MQRERPAPSSGLCPLPRTGTEIRKSPCFPSMVAGPKFWATVPHFRDHFCLPIHFENGPSTWPNNIMSKITYMLEFNMNPTKVPVS